MADTTRQLAEFVVERGPGSLPADVRHQGLRALVNWIGCVLGGCQSPSTVRGIAALAEFSGPAEATIIGHRRRVDIMQAAFFNCMSNSAHVFDDTHLASVAHPTGPVGSAALALAERIPTQGKELLEAIILGVEVTCRVANALTAPPAKSHLGLFMTGMTGGIGAAVACGKLLKLDTQQMIWAIGSAVAQASGVRAMHATDAAPLMTGNAARAGLTSALLATKGFTASERGIEAPQRGFADVFAAPANLDAVTAGLGTEFEISSLTYKPYPCGIVAHPSIHACLDLARDHDIAACDVARVDLLVNPVTLELTAIRDPKNEMQSHNSVYHWVAASFIHRSAGLGEDAFVHDPAFAAFRHIIHATAEADMPPDACKASVTLKDGRTFSTEIDHCIGSVARPMSDAELDEKFHGQAVGTLDHDKADSLLRQLWAIDEVADIAAMTRHHFG